MSRTYASTPVATASVGTWAKTEPLGTRNAADPVATANVGTWARRTVDRGNESAPVATVGVGVWAMLPIPKHRRGLVLGMGISTQAGGFYLS